MLWGWLWLLSDPEDLQKQAPCDHWEGIFSLSAGTDALQCLCYVSERCDRQLSGHQRCCTLTCSPAQPCLCQPVLRDGGRGDSCLCSHGLGQDATHQPNSWQFCHQKHGAGLSNLWDTEHPEQKNILRSWGVWERPGGWWDRSWVWTPRVPWQRRRAAPPTPVCRSTALEKGLSSSPWHFLDRVWMPHSPWYLMDSGKATEWPGRWKGSVPRVFTAQLDAALNSILWALCGRSDQTRHLPSIRSHLKYSVI